MTWRTRLGLLVATAAALVAVGAAPASAADELGLSADGVTWADALPGPLFDPDFRWVPGDAETASFWVRNQSVEDGILDVTLLTGPVESLIETGDLTVSAQVDGGAYTAANTAGPHRLVNQVAVPAGAEREVTVKVDLAPGSTNLSQDLRLDLRFVVALSQDTTAVQPPTDGGDDDGGGVAGPGGDLPDTGAVITPAMLLLAAVLVAAGTGLIGYSRRRLTRLEERSSHVQA